MSYLMETYTPMKGERDPRWVRFGGLLDELRRKQQLNKGERITWTQVADDANLSYKQVSRIANGESGTEYDTVARLLAAMGLKPSDGGVKELYESVGWIPPTEEPTILSRRPFQTNDANGTHPPEVDGDTDVAQIVAWYGGIPKKLRPEAMRAIRAVFGLVRIEGEEETETEPGKKVSRN